MHCCGLIPMDYEPLVRRLTELLERSRIPYMFVGGIAVTYWGLPRTTMDVDVAVALSQENVPKLARPLKRLKFDAHEHDMKLIARVGNIVQMHSPATPHRVDLWIPRTAFEQEALTRRRRVTLYGKATWLVAPEDLALMKLLAGREKDWPDAAGIMKRQHRQLDADYMTRRAKRLDLSETLQRLRRGRAS